MSPEPLVTGDAERCWDADQRQHRYCNCANRGHCDIRAGMGELDVDNAGSGERHDSGLIRRLRVGLPIGGEAITLEIGVFCILEGSQQKAIALANGEVVLKQNVCGRPLDGGCFTDGSVLKRKVKSVNCTGSEGNFSEKVSVRCLEYGDAVGVNQVRIFAFAFDSGRAGFAVLGQSIEAIGVVDADVHPIWSSVGIGIRATGSEDLQTIDGDTAEVV